MVPLILFLLFTALPLLETYLLIEVGRVIGGWETVAYLFAIGSLGAWMGRRAGVGVLGQIGADLRAGRSPADSVVEGVLVVIGAVLLVTPGVLTDVAGFLLFVPPVRRRLAPRLKAWLVGRMAGGARSGFAWQFGAMGPGPAARGERAASQPVADSPPPRGGFDHPSF